MINNQTDPKDKHKEQTFGQSGAQGTAQQNDGASPQIFTEEEFEKLKKELEETQKKLHEMTTITQHALADLQNFHRRSEEDKKNWVLYANAELLLELLPAIDNMNRALIHEPKDAGWTKGIEQTMRQFWQILEKRNLKIIETKDQKFDPKIHEALMTGPGEKDIVLEEFEKGYMLGEKVLKPARVSVGNGEK